MVRVGFQTLVTPSLNENKDTEAGRTFDETPDDGCKLHKQVVGVSTLPRNPESGWIFAVGLGETVPSLSEVVGYGSEGHEWEQVNRNILFAMSYRCLSHGVLPYRHHDNTPSDSLD